MKKRLIFAVAVLAVFFSVPAQAQQAAVPNVVGMPADQAIKTVEAVMVVTDAKGRKHNYKLHLTQANK